MVAAKDEKTGRKKRTQIWPRYHQLDVRRLLADAAAHGVGRCYLIQHLAGNGKSNSIAWLAHQLIGLVSKHRPANEPGAPIFRVFGVTEQPCRLTREAAPVFDSIIVVTDRVILDRQIRDTIRQYAQVGATVEHADRAGDNRLMESRKLLPNTSYFAWNRRRDPSG